MGKLKLEFERHWNKEFVLSELNLLFVFQVNCPGCFTHGFPMVEQIREKYRADLNFVTLSTAFEDFDLNTSDNTSLLIEDAAFVGEVKKAEAFHRLDENNLPRDYPVLMDKLVKPDEFLTEDMIGEVCNTNPNYRYWSSFDQKLLQQKVIDYYKHNEWIALTFHLNQFRGTPTFVIFNKEYDILDTWFGHKPLKEVEMIIDKWI